MEEKQKLNTSWHLLQPPEPKAASLSNGSGSTDPGLTIDSMKNGHVTATVTSPIGHGLSSGGCPSAITISFIRKFGFKPHLPLTGDLRVEGSACSCSPFHAVVDLELTVS